MRATIFAGALLALASAPAVALDFTQPLVGPDSTPLQECKAAAEDKHCARLGPMILGEVVAGALWSPDPSASSPTEQVRRVGLAQRVLNAKSADLSSEDVTLIKAQVARLVAERGYSPMVTYGVVKIIDPGALPKS